MKIRICDICEKEIENHETYYEWNEHWWNGFQAHQKTKIEICNHCMKTIQKICKEKADE